MRSHPSFLRLISTVALSTTIAIAPLAIKPHFEGIRLPAAEAAQQKAVKLTASQLMTKMEQALVVISQRLKARPAKERSRSAPLVKALVDTSRALKAVKKAAASKNSKALAQALPKASASVARLDNAYRLSGIKAQDVSVGVKSLKSLWQDYLKRSAGSKAGASKKNAVSNSRRINAMRKQLANLAGKRSKDARARYELEEMQRRLDRAEAANRSLANQWLATILLAEVFGIYSGYYDYVVIYHPDDVIYYRDSYTYFSAEVYHSYSEYSVYYESYSWSTYDAPVVVYDDYTFGMNSREYSRFESTYVSTYERYETVTETTIVNQQEIRQIDTANQTIQAEAAKIETAANVPDPQADAVEVVDDNATPDSFLEQPAAAAAEEAVPADDTAVDPAQAEPAAVEDPAAAGQRSADVPAAAEQPAAEEPAPAEEPAAQEPAAEQPQAEEPAAEPQAEEPAPAEEPQAEEPAPAEEPQAEEPAPAEEPQAEEPAPAEEPQAEEPAPAEEPQAEEPAPAEEPQAEEPAPAEEPQAEEPAPAEEPQAEEPAPAEEPQAEEPAPAEEPQAEEPAPAEEPQAEEPAPAEEPQAEEPAPAEEPQAEEPAPAEEPQAEEPAPAEEPQMEEQAPAEEPAPAEEAPACDTEECPQ